MFGLNGLVNGRIAPVDLITKTEPMPDPPARSIIAIKFFLNCYAQR